MRTLLVIMTSVALVGPWFPKASRAAQTIPAGIESPKASPEPEASTEDIDGQQAFLNTCGFCHEDGGRAAGRGPKLANSARSDEFIINRIKKGKPGSMPAFGSAFSDSQIIAILAYIRGLND